MQHMRSAKYKRFTEHVHVVLIAHIVLWFCTMYCGKNLVWGRCACTCTQLLSFLTSPSSAFLLHLFLVSFIFLCLCLSVSLSLFVFVSLSFSVSLSLSLSSSLSFHLSLSLFVIVSLSLFLCFSLFVFRFLCLSLCLSVVSLSSSISPLLPLVKAYLFLSITFFPRI